MNDRPMTPLFTLAVSIAYMTKADQVVSVQERAEWISVFGQLVESGEYSKKQLEKLTQDAFAYSTNTELSAFLEKAVPQLSLSQKILILTNLYDTVLADGALKEGERTLFAHFSRAFGVDNKTVKFIREFLTFKNDLTLLTNDLHPFNDDKFSLSYMFQDL